MSRLEVRRLTRRGILELTGGPAGAGGREDQLVRPNERRASLPDSVTIHLSGKGWQRSVDAFCRDLSMQGIDLFTRRDLAVNQAVELDINLPDRILTTPAVVAYCTAVPGGHHVGLRFVFPSDDPASEEAATVRQASLRDVALPRPDPPRIRFAGTPPGRFRPASEHLPG